MEEAGCVHESTLRMELEGGGWGPKTIGLRWFLMRKTKWEGADSILNKD